MRQATLTKTFPDNGAARAWIEAGGYRQGHIEGPQCALCGGPVTVTLRGEDAVAAIEAEAGVAVIKSDLITAVLVAEPGRSEAVLPRTGGVGGATVAGG